MPVINKARKGDVVAVRVEHSHHDVKMRRYSRMAFHLAHVEQASREGLVRRIRFAGQTHSLEAARIGEVMTIIGERQTAAKALADEIQWPGREYASADELRAAVLAKAEGRS